MTTTIIEYVTHTEDLSPQYTVNIDVCEVVESELMAYGATNFEVVEAVGPAGGNPNINVTFDYYDLAIGFLIDYMDLCPELDDLQSYFV